MSTIETQPPATRQDFKPRACDACGQTDAYEPILFDGRDLCASLPFYCQSCTAGKEAEELDQQRTSAIDRRRQTWIDTIPAEYRATDLKHPAFRLDKWDRLKGFSYLSEFLGLVSPPGRCKTRFLALFAKRAINLDISTAWTNTFEIEEQARLRGRYSTAADAARQFACSSKN